MELNFHICLVYIFLNKIKPKFVVESGIYKGQTTWLIEKTLPKAKILAIDINLESRTYISKSKNVKYSNIDFSSHNFEKIPTESLVFLMIIKISIKDCKRHIFLVSNM